MKRNRRRATHAELIRESKDNPGYFRYNITIQELDGSKNVVPAYGKDLEDAIERLLWTERIGKINKKKGILPIFVVLLLGIVALSGVFAVEDNNPIWIAFGLGFASLSLVISNYIDSYLNKK